MPNRPLRRNHRGRSLTARLTRLPTSSGRSIVSHAMGERSRIERNRELIRSLFLTSLGKAKRKNDRTRTTAVQHWPLLRRRRLRRADVGPRRVQAGTGLPAWSAGRLRGGRSSTRTLHTERGPSWPSWYGTAGPRSRSSGSVASTPRAGRRHGGCGSSRNGTSTTTSLTNPRRVSSTSHSPSTRDTPGPASGWGQVRSHFRA